MRDSVFGASNRLPGSVRRTTAGKNHVTSGWSGKSETMPAERSPTSDLRSLAKHPDQVKTCNRLFSPVRYRIDKRRSGSGQLQHCDLRSRTEPDGQASYANAAIHVELLAT